MGERLMSELELALVRLGRQIEFPPTPELAPACVRAWPKAARRACTGRTPGLVIALAAVVVAIGAVMAVPQTRAAILEFFRLRGVTVERVDELPTVSIPIRTSTSSSSASG